jgi:hypothetical protein
MRFEELLAKLEAAGFFETAAAGEISSIGQVMLNDRNLFPEEIGRVFHADAEALAERGVLEFMAQLAPQLAQRGVYVPIVEMPLRPVKMRNPLTGEVSVVARTRLRVDDSIPDPAGVKYLRPVREDSPESGEYYRVTVGARTREIWNSGMGAAHTWEAAMCHTVLLLNQLLEDAGHAERLFGLYGGNEGMVVFLTPKQFELIRACEAIKDKETPWEAYEVSLKL